MLIFKLTRLFLWGGTYKIIDSIFKKYNLRFKEIIEINGIKYNIDTNNYHERRLFVFGTFEPELQREMKKICNKDGIYIDIGANIGIHTLFLGKNTSDKSKTISFEPNIGIFNKLKENLSLNNFKNTNIFNLGLGDIKRDMELIIPKVENNNTYNNPGKASLVENTFGENHKKIKVKIETLENIFKQNQLNISNVKLIKMDVEGFELNVLKGADKILENSNIALFIEYNKNNYEEISTYLEKFGYKSFGSIHRFGINKEKLFNNILFKK